MVATTMDLQTGMSRCRHAPQFTQSAKGPEARVSRIRIKRGFTLVETSAVVMIMAILTALAAPSFRDFTTGQRIRTTSFDLFADLTFARSEAIKANSEVIIGKSSNSWNNGWNITWVDSAGTTRTLRSAAALGSSLNVAGTQDLIRFERNGRMLAGTPAAKFTMTDAAGRQPAFARCIAVDPSGRAKTTVGACT